MNFAILRKIRALPGTSAQELINQVKNSVIQARLLGMVEVAFYLSADDAQEIYLASFWWNSQDVQNGKEKAYEILLPTLENKGIFLENYTFQLVWDFRRLPQPGQASVLRLLTLPDDYSETWIMKNIAATRQGTHARDNVRAAWIGRSIENPKYMMHRTDWIDLQSQHDYFSSNSIQNTIAIYRASGVTLNYASFDLQGILLPDEVLEG